MSASSRKYKLQKRPVYEHTDKRASDRWHTEEYERKKARRIANKLLGKNYFTNMQAVMLEAAIEMSERKK
jgi:hypothetical protein